MTGKPSGRLAGAVAGGVAATALWLTAAALGADDISGVGSLHWLWLAVVVGAVLGSAGLGRFLTGLAAATVGLLLVVSWVPFFGGLARGYVRSDSLPATPVDAVVVLAASVSSDSRLSPAAVDRLLEGIRL